MPAISRVLQVLQFFNEVDPGLQVQQVRVFLLLAERAPDTMSQTAVADALDMTTSSVSRAIQKLSTYKVKNPKTGAWASVGLRLLEKEVDPSDTRAHLVTLSGAGKELAARITEIIT